MNLGPFSQGCWSSAVCSLLEDHSEGKGDSTKEGIRPVLSAVWAV